MQELSRTSVRDLVQNLKNGIFLPIIDQCNMNGLGYLIDIFYPNLFFYLPGLLRFVLPVNIALQVAVVIYNLLFGISYIRIIKRIYNNEKLAYGFTILYLSSYYLFIDLISRQAISEYFSALIFPLVLLGMVDLLKNNKWKLLYISMTLVVYTHLLSLVAYSALIVIILIFNYKIILANKTIIINLLKAAISAILTGLAFLLPFIKYFTAQKYFLSSTFEHFITVTNPTDILYIIGFFVILAVMFVSYNIFSEKISKELLFAINGLIFSIYMSTDLCNWDVLTFFKIFQYKIRIGLFINIFAIVILSYLIYKKKFWLRLIVLSFCFLFVEDMLGNIFNSGTNKVYEKVQVIDDCVFNIEKDANFDEKYCEIVFAEYLPLDLVIEKEPFINSCSEKSIIDNSKYLMSLDFENIEESRKGSMYIIEPESSEMTISKIYYPTYRVYQKDNSDIEIENYNGFIKIKNIDDGEIILKFGPTLLQWISFIISLVSILIIYFLTKQDGNDAIYKERK